MFVSQKSVMLSRTYSRVRPPDCPSKALAAWILDHDLRSYKLIATISHTFWAGQGRSITRLCVARWQVATVRRFGLFPSAAGSHQRCGVDEHKGRPGRRPRTQGGMKVTLSNSQSEE